MRRSRRTASAPCGQSSIHGLSSSKKTVSKVLWQLFSTHVTDAIM